MMNPTQILRIFHPADFTKGDENAYAHALRIALDAKAFFSLVHVGGLNSDDHWDDFPGIRETLSRWGVISAAAHRAEVSKTGLKVEKVQRRGRDPVESILAYLEEHEPDLVVLSTHQRTGLSRWIHGAMAEKISHASKAMTLFVPRRVSGFVSSETGRVRLQTVLVPIDHTPRPQAAVDAAVLLASTLGSKDVRFLLLFVGPEEDAPEVRLPKQEGWVFENQTWGGATVVDHILATAEANDVDLIVMSTQGNHGFLDALRGSTTERVVRGAQCPVLAVNAP